MRSTTTKKSRGGWHWTKRGWQRGKPQRRALAANPPKKHKPRKPVVVVAPSEREKPAFGWRASQIAQEGLLRRSAPTPAAASETPTTRPPRAAWGGKYDQLNTPKPEP